MNKITLKDTIKMMMSDDWKDRFRAEYWQLRIREERLSKMLDKWEKDELDFTPNCPYDVLAKQYNAMYNYIEALKMRAEIEKIDLDRREGGIRFKKKPIEIEAVQYTGDNEDEIAEFMHLPVTALQRGADTLFPSPDEDYRKNKHILIPTLEGTMAANCGDWIIRGVKGEFYPCKPDIFDETYEKVEE